MLLLFLIVVYQSRAMIKVKIIFSYYLNIAFV